MRGLVAGREEPAAIALGRLELEDVAVGIDADQVGQPDPAGLGQLAMVDAVLLEMPLELFIVVDQEGHVAGGRVGGRVGAGHGRLTDDQVDLQDTRGIAQPKLPAVVDPRNRREFSAAESWGLRK